MTNSLPLPAFVIGCLLLGTGSLLKAADPPERLNPASVWRESADEIETKVAARRGETRLSKLAASMEPGTWAELKTRKPAGLWSAPKPGRGLHIGTWSDDAHWDSRTGQFLFFGVRQTRKFVAYSEQENAWRVIPFHEKLDAPGLEQQFGHQYSTNSFDPVRSRFFDGPWRYNVVEDTWSKLPPCQHDRKTMTWEYFSAMDGVVSVSHQPKGIVRFHPEGAKQCRKLDTISVHGYHSLARHNPYREEVLFAGGNGIRTVIALTKDGTFKQLNDFPLKEGNFTIRSGMLTVDPLSGRYLFLIGRNFVEYDSRKDQYRLIEDFEETGNWPFNAHQAPVVAWIPEYGVAMWADESGDYLYKHDASANLEVINPR